LNELLNVVVAVQISFKCVGSVYLFALSQVNCFLNERAEIWNCRLIMSHYADVHAAAQLKNSHFFFAVQSALLLALGN
jgi:hypothetical protein